MKPITYYLLLLIIFTSCKNSSQLQNGSFQAELDDLTINYTIKGAGPVMIVGHINSGKIAYENSLSPLEQHFTMVYYEPRGTGASDAPKTIEEYGYEFIIKEIDNLRLHLGIDKIWLFGHSDQSEIALEYAIDYPNNIAGMILSGTHFVEDNETEFSIKKTFEEFRRKDEWFNQVVKDFDYKFKHKTDFDSLGRDISLAPIKWWCYDSLSAQKVIPLYNLTTERGRRKPINGQFPFMTNKDRYNLYQRIYNYQKKYSEIKTDILILQGRFDTNNPPEMTEKLNQQLPNSELIFIEEAGHFPWVEQPEKSFKAISKWLNSRL